MTCHESDYLMGSSDNIQILYSLVIFSVSCRKCFVYNLEAVGSIRMKREVCNASDLTGDYTNCIIVKQGCLMQWTSHYYIIRMKTRTEGKFSFYQFSRNNCIPKGLFKAPIKPRELVES